MSVFAKARARDLETGYAMDFIGCAMKPWIGEIVDKRIKVITDAGGRLRQYRCDRAAFTPERVQACFNGLTRGEVTAYPLPGIHGINSLFLLAQSLDGWSFSSLHLDAQAKTYSQVLLEPETAVPE